MNDVADLERVQDTRARVYEVSGAEPIEAHYLDDVRFMPSSARVTFDGDGQFTHMFISGGRLRKDGTPGARQTWNSYSPAKVASLPDWAKPLTVYDAPQAG